MISGIVLLSTLLLGANPPPSAPVDSVPSDTAALIASLRRPAPADTAYTEVRFLHVLQRPLILHGELHYGGANQLGKRVDKPYREATTIADGEVSVERDGKAARHFSLDRAPELQGLLAGFGALLGGDAAVLNQHYAIALERSSVDWRLTLTPRAAALAKQLRDMVVDGSAADTRCFTLREADGDASVMLLGALAAVKLSDPPTPAGVDALCRGGKP
jgi:hypothetical protein